MRVRLDHTEEAAHNIVSFYFRPARTVRYTAGQFIELTVPHNPADNRGVRHWFTLSSSPTEELVSITTKFPVDKASTFKQRLKQLKPGDEILMSDPMGDFVLPKDKTTPIVFVAGGIGVTPMRSMAAWLADTGEQRPIKLIYAANNRSELAFGELFKAAGIDVEYVLAEPSKDWKGRSGRLSAADILEIAPDTDNQLYFVSGPEGMVEGLVRGLKDAGVKRSRIIGDYFPNYEKI